MFSHLPELPPDPIYGMQEVFKNDSRQDKINLSIGILLNNFGKIQTMEAVAMAQVALLPLNPTRNYLPITGLVDFCKASQSLIAPDIEKDEIFTAQTLGGTGGLYVVAKMLSASGIGSIYISDPSWPNHRGLFQAAGLKVTNYPYYNRQKRDLDFDAFLSSIATMAPKSAIVLQAACHNPTGVDPTASQWKSLSLAIKRQNLLPIFDVAYLGLGGSFEDDLQGVRTFLDDGHEMFIVTTYSKTFGLYNDRIGSLTVRTSKETLKAIESQIRAIIRACYSSPPAYGARLISKILDDGTMRASWKHELEEISGRLQSQRKLLHEAMKRQGCRLAFDHLLTTKGLFCLLDLSKEQVLKLQRDRGLYLALDGRISLPAVNELNVESIAKSLSTV